MINEYKVILLMSSPGEVNRIGSKISKLFSTFGYINFGKCLKNRIHKESQRGVSRWKVSKSLMSNGDLVPEVFFCYYMQNIIF